MATLASIRETLAGAKRFIVLAGAGMSAELDVPTYWAGPTAKYASTVSEYGYTELEHADAGLWVKDPASQVKFFQNRHINMMQVNPKTADSPYVKLLTFLRTKRAPHFVVTSNVDSFFLRSGFSEGHLYELHGSYRVSQCLAQPRLHGVFPTDTSGLTACPVCGSMTRPNAVFFNDFDSNPDLRNRQKIAYDDFREDMMTANRDVVLEIGAGNTIPTIRNMSVILNGRFDLPVIRINPHTVDGVDGIAGVIPKSKTAPFVHVRQPVSRAFNALFKQ